MEQTLKNKLKNSLEQLNKLTQEEVEFYVNRCENLLTGCEETEITLDGNKVKAMWAMIVCNKNNFLNTNANIVVRDGMEYEIDHLKSLVAIIKNDDQLILAESEADYLSKDGDALFDKENEIFSSLSEEEIRSKYF